MINIIFTKIISFIYYIKCNLIHICWTYSWRSLFRWLHKGCTYYAPTSIHPTPPCQTPFSRPAHLQQATFICNKRLIMQDTQINNCMVCIAPAAILTSANDMCVFFLHQSFKRHLKRHFWWGTSKYMLSVPLKSSNWHYVNQLFLSFFFQSLFFSGVAVVL